MTQLTGLRLPLAALALLGAAAAQAETLDASIGERTFRAGLDGSLGRWVNTNDGIYDLGVVAGSIEDAHGHHFLSSHAAVMLSGDAGVPNANVLAAIGLRGQWVHTAHDDGGAVALGGQVRIGFPGYNRIAFHGDAWFAPGVSSFGDIDKFDEIGADVGYEVLRNAEVYVGYRWIGVSGDPGGHVDLEEGGHVGFRLKFGS